MSTKEPLVTWSNLIKGGTLLLGIVAGVYHIEGYIKETVTSAIDARLENWISRTTVLETEIKAVQAIQAKQTTYLVNNSYRLGYHEELFRNTQRFLNSKFPKEFLKPEELRFNDFKQERDGN